MLLFWFLYELISLMKKNIQTTMGEQVFISDIPHIPLMLKIQ